MPTIPKEFDDKLKQKKKQREEEEPPPSIPVTPQEELEVAGSPQRTGSGRRTTFADTATFKAQSFDEGDVTAVTVPTIVEPPALRYFVTQLP